MAAARQLDNSTFVQKMRLRNRVLAQSGPAVDVLETHGGFGRIFERTWYRAERGAVIERDSVKVEHLARQRPRWAVYEGDSLQALRCGLFASRAFDIVDLDPYGSTLTYFAPLFDAHRRRPGRWWLVANCGLRHTLGLKQAWRIEVLQELAARLGAASDFYHRYLDVVQLLLTEHANASGQRLTWFDGYYCGHGNNMTHYAARIETPPLH